jgi:excisionase family DNA binding protein
MHPPAPNHVTTQEAAKLLMVTPSRVAQLLRDGRIPGAYKVGPESRRGIWVIPLAEDGLPIVTPPSKPYWGAPPRVPCGPRPANPFAKP